MTTLEAVHTAPPNAGATQLGHSQQLLRIFSSSAFLLGGICTVFAVISLRVKANANPFQDEGLYLYMGHRMIDHIVSGVHVSEYPGGYLSGAPGLHPVVGAIADSVAGVQGARLVSLFLVCIAIVATYGIGNELFGKLSGLLGAGAFALCGSVIFISQLATMDAMALCLMTLGCWLTVYSANHDKLLWAPIVGLILTLAFLTKYATASLRSGDRCDRHVARLAPHSMGSIAAWVSGRYCNCSVGVLHSELLGCGSQRRNSLDDDESESTQPYSSKGNDLGRRRMGRAVDLACRAGRADASASVAAFGSAAGHVGDRAAAADKDGGDHVAVEARCVRNRLRRTVDRVAARLDHQTFEVGGTPHHGGSGGRDGGVRNQVLGAVPDNVGR